MNYKFLLFLLQIIIKISFEQIKNNCDKNQDCGNCTICGHEKNNYCSCNFYNVYCKNGDSNNNITILTDFLQFYDGCILGNGEMENICGNSNLNIDIGINNTIHFVSSDNINFFCFYNVKILNSNNNEIKILIKKEGNDTISSFNLHLIVYYNYNRIQYSSRMNLLLDSSNVLELIEIEVEKISIYIDIPDGKNMDKISINLSIVDKVVKRISYISNNNNINKGLIYGIVIGVISILLIVVIIYLIKKFKTPPLSYEHSFSNDPIIIKPNYSPQIIRNIYLLNNLFKKELIPKQYLNKNIVNDCTKCTICLEDFKEEKSIVITTKCKHTFHYKCFKDWAFKNIKFPKCPNCNSQILVIENNNGNNSIALNNTINNYNHQNNALTFGTLSTSY